MTQERIDDLKNLVSQFSKFNEKDYLCIGYGIAGMGGLSGKYGIPQSEIYQYEQEYTVRNNFVGVIYNELYYITKKYYSKVIYAPLTRGEAITKAETFIGKTVLGHTNEPFLVTDVRIVNKLDIPTWLTGTTVETTINQQGWAAIVENDMDFKAFDEAEEVITVVLNDEYTAVIDGDIVRVGCQEISITNILKLAELIKSNA